MKINEYDNNTKIYFNGIKNFKPLTLKEEKILFLNYKKGDIESRNKLINSNLKFVVNVAKNYRNRGVTFSDLISEGNCGLMRAIEKYDNKYNNKLTSYAVHWIRYFIEDKINKENIVLNHQYEIKDYSIPIDILEKIRKGGTYMEFEEYEDKTFIDIPDEEDNREICNHDKLILDNLLSNNLSNREIEILTYIFGLNNSEVLNLKEIASKLKISQERVRQIKEKALRKIRTKCLENNIELNILGYE